MLTVVLIEGRPAVWQGGEASKDGRPEGLSVEQAPWIGGFEYSEALARSVWVLFIRGAYDCSTMGALLCCHPCNHVPIPSTCKAAPSCAVPRPGVVCEVTGLTQSRVENSRKVSEPRRPGAPSPGIDDSDRVQRARAGVSVFAQHTIGSACWQPATK